MSSHGLGAARRELPGCADGGARDCAHQAVVGRDAVACRHAAVSSGASPAGAGRCRPEHSPQSTASRRRRYRKDPHHWRQSRGEQNQTLATRDGGKARRRGAAHRALGSSATAELGCNGQESYCRELKPTLAKDSDPAGAKSMRSAQPEGIGPLRSLAAEAGRTHSLQEKDLP